VHRLTSAELTGVAAGWRLQAKGAKTKLPLLPSPLPPCLIASCGKPLKGHDPMDAPTLALPLPAHAGARTLSLKPPVASDVLLGLVPSVSLARSNFCAAPLARRLRAPVHACTAAVAARSPPKTALGLPPPLIAANGLLLSGQARVRHCCGGAARAPRLAHLRSHVFLRHAPGSIRPRWRASPAPRPAWPSSARDVSLSCFSWNPAGFCSPGWSASLCRGVGV
jgi:hypothetical protein